MDGPVGFALRRSSTCSRDDDVSNMLQKDMGNSAKLTKEYLLSTFNEPDGHLISQNFLGSGCGGYQDIQPPSTFGEPGDTRFMVDKLGEPNTTHFRAVFRRHSDACIISPWHDIPLYDKRCQLRFICTTPCLTSLQHCFSAQEPYTPLRCRPEHTEGSTKQQQQHPFWQKAAAAPLQLAAVSHFVSACPWNVGVLPQTLHSKDDVFFSCPELAGSGAPLEIIEISGRRAPLGAVFTVKPVAAFAVQSGPLEFCWKVVGVAGDCPLAADILTLQDVEKLFPGELQRVQDWLAMCCSYSDSREAFPSPQGPDEARIAVAQANATWQLFVEEEGIPDPAEAPLGLTREILSSIYGDSVWVRSWGAASEDPFADCSDADLSTPQSARSKAGAGFQGFGKLLRTASFRSKNTMSSNSKLQKKQNLLRPPTAPHPSFAPAPASSAASQQLPWQHVSRPSRSASTEMDSKAEGQQARQAHRSWASVDLGLNSNNQQQPAEHLRRKSDMLPVEGSWGDIMFVDGNSTVNPSGIPEVYPKSVRSPSCSPGFGSPAGYTNTMEHGMPVNELLSSRKQTNLSPYMEHGAPPKTAGSLRNRSHYNSARIPCASDSSMETFIGITRPQMSSRRTADRDVGAQDCGDALGEGGQVLAFSWSKGMSPSHTPDQSSESSPDVTPSGHRREGEERQGVKGGGVGSCLLRTRSATVPRLPSPACLSSQGIPLSQEPSFNLVHCTGGHTQEPGCHHARAQPFPRSRSATVPRNLTPLHEQVGVESVFGRMNSAGRRVSFHEEVDLVLLLDNEVHLGQGSMGEVVSGGRSGSCGNVIGSALHVSMPLAQDGNGPSLGSPRLQ